MKLRLLTILIFCSFSSKEKQNPYSEQLATYLKHKDFFRLERCFNANRQHLNTKDYLYYSAVIDNAFNRCGPSARDIDQLLKNYTAKLNLRTKAALLALQVDNYVKTYNYAKAAKTNELLISIYKQLGDTTQMADLKNTGILWHALAKVPLQQITPHVDVRMTWKRDAANLINIPITINNETADFVFDTGANISTISKSYAGKLGLQLIQTSFDLGSGTSITNKASLAVAPSLKISGIELKNVIFMVLPDDQLSFPQINYSIHGIIGFPVINQLGEVHVAKNGTMFIPAKPQAGKVHNLALDELTPIISLATNRDTLSYTFDTGAKESELFKLYFDKYIAEIKQTGKADTIKRGGAGGVVKYLVYKLPLFHFKVSSKEVNLPGIAVLTTLEGAKDEFYYGNIGQDLIGNFDEMMINFKQMYIDFK